MKKIQKSNIKTPTGITIGNNSINAAITIAPTNNKIIAHTIAANDSSKNKIILTFLEYTISYLDNESRPSYGSNSNQYY